MSTNSSFDEFSDAELTEMALAADPNAPLALDAVAWNGTVFGLSGLLPNWYMPAPTPVHRGGWARTVVVTLIVGFLVIDAFGLCITSGFLSLA